VTALTGHVVDAHHHLWNPARRDYPWMNGEAFAAIRRTYGLAELDAVTSAAGVGATVLVQTVPDLIETAEFCALAAESAGLVAGVVGWVDLSLGGAVTEQLDQLRAGFGGGRLVGFRHQVQDESQRDWLLRDDVGAAIAKVGAAGLVYEMLVLTDQLRSVVDLAARLDTMTFVLDHAAKPPFTGGPDIWDVWKSGVAALAAQPNVACKLSGLATEANWSSWDANTLRPAVEHVLEVFGPDRLMFGSDWPVCELAGPYREMLAAANKLTESCTPSEREQIFSRTATRVYRLA
jgi:L-fuconolactonase